MRTVQMTLDEELVAEIDRVIKKLGFSRSAFTRRALRAELERIKMANLEHKHAEGYRRKPVARGEFDVWEAEQVWPD